LDLFLLELHVGPPSEIMCTRRISDQLKSFQTNHAGPPSKIVSTRKISDQLRNFWTNQNDRVEDKDQN